MATLTQATTRDATTDDLMALADMGARFVEWSPYSTLGASRDEIAAGIMRVLDGGGFVRVLEQDGRAVGMLIGTLSPLWFAPSVVVAAELAWWVEDGASGGLRLLQDFHAWARAHGASHVQGSDLVGPESPAGHIYESLRYRLVERAWIKRLR